MRVRISYGLDIKKVPSKIQDLVFESIEILESSGQLLRRIADDLENSEENIKQILSTVDKIRLKLSEVDLSIADTQSISQGLNNYYNGDKDVSDRRSTVDPSGDTTTETEGLGEG